MTISLEVGPTRLEGRPADFTQQVQTHLEMELEKRGVRVAPRQRLRLVARCHARQAGTEQFERRTSVGDRSKQRVTIPLTECRCQIAVVDGSAEPLWERTDERDSSRFVWTVVVPPNEDPASYIRKDAMKWLVSEVQEFFSGDFPAARALFAAPRQWDYGPTATTRKLYDQGVISFRGREYKLGKAFRGRRAGLRPLDQDGRYGPVSAGPRSMKLTFGSGSRTPFGSPNPLYWDLKPVTCVFEDLLPLTPL